MGGSDIGISKFVMDSHIQKNAIIRIHTGLVKKSKIQGCLRQFQGHSRLYVYQEVEGLKRVVK